MRKLFLVSMLLIVPGYLLGSEDENIKEENNKQVYDAIQRDDYVKLVQLFNEGKVDLNSYISEDKTALMVAVDRAVKTHDKKILNLLIDKGADLNSREEEKNILLYVINYGKSTRDESIVPLLLDRGADVNTNIGGDKFGAAILLNAAVRKNDFKTVKLFLQKGAIISELVKARDIVLFVKVEVDPVRYINLWNIAKILVVFGADIKFQKDIDLKELGGDNKKFILKWGDLLNEYNKNKKEIDEEFEKYKNEYEKGVRAVVEKHMIPDITNITMDYFGKDYEYISPFEYFVHTRHKDRIPDFNELLSEIDSGNKRVEELRSGNKSISSTSISSSSSSAPSSS